MNINKNISKNSKLFLKALYSGNNVKNTKEKIEILKSKVLRPRIIPIFMSYSSIDNQDEEELQLLEYLTLVQCGLEKQNESRDY